MNQNFFRSSIDDINIQSVTGLVSPAFRPKNMPKPPTNPRGPNDLSHLNTPNKALNQRRPEHEVDSDESVDEEADAESGVQMKSIKFLCRIDNLIVRAQYKRSLEFVNRFKLMTINSIRSKQLLQKRIALMSKMKLFKRFGEKLRLYPRKAILKWKIVSDDLFLAKRIPKIALTSRINHQVAIMRMKYMINLRKTSQ